MSAEARKEHYIRRTKVADEMLLWLYDVHMEADGPVDRFKSCSDVFWDIQDDKYSGLEVDRAAFWLKREGFVTGDDSEFGLEGMEPTAKGERFVESGLSVGADTDELRHRTLSITSFGSNISIDSPGSVQSATPRPAMSLPVRLASLSSHMG